MSMLQTFEMDIQTKKKIEKENFALLILPKLGFSCDFSCLSRILFKITTIMLK